MSSPRSTPLPLIGEYAVRIRTFSPNARRYLIGTFLMGIAHGAVWVHLNLYFQAIGLGEETIGRILSSQSFGTVLMALPAALLIDRHPARHVFGAAAVGYALAIAGFVLVPDARYLPFVAMLAGSAFTTHWAAAAPFFMRNSDSQERLYLFGFAHAIETTATIIAAIGVGWVAGVLGARLGGTETGLRVAFLVVAGLSLTAVWPFRAIEGPPEHGGRRLRDYLAARNWGLIGKLVLPSALVGLGAGLIIPFLNLYFRERFHQDPLQIGTYFAVSQAFTVLGFLLGPMVARRAGIIVTVVATELASIPFFLLLAFSKWLGPSVVAFWMRGALMNMNHPLQTNFAMEVVEADQQAVTNSLRMLGWNLSWMISTQVGGWVIERRGFTLPMLITIGLYAIAAVVTFLFWRDRRTLGRAT
ncbi:MAG: MFS transporter [Candidatus Eisenbacteria bacterium]|uniref:MFS transporter n=1 Tax=Eiseniibacteriota bacterium TaxID=2212470 RepID=A0A956M0J1_UNCEI|nr:MFS transporter [Candidatus Eisenbacteria bacterium]